MIVTPEFCRLTSNITALLELEFLNFLFHDIYMYMLFKPKYALPAIVHVVLFLRKGIPITSITNPIVSKLTSFT
jgi:hypothetical protein